MGSVARASLEQMRNEALGEGASASGPSVPKQVTPDMADKLLNMSAIAEYLKHDKSGLHDSLQQQLALARLSPVSTIDIFHELGVDPQAPEKGAYQLIVLGFRWLRR